MLRRVGRLVSAIFFTAAMTLAGGIQFTPAVTTASANPLQNMDPRLRAHVSGPAEQAFGSAPRAAARPVDTYFPVSGNGCTGNIGTNIKVNQNCLNVTDADLQGRGQAQNETSIAVDPNNANRLVASYNDYRRGDGTCGVDYTSDGGAHWKDATTPNGFTRGDAFGAARQYWQSSGDTSVAFDTRGNVYLSCQAFLRGAGVTSNPDQSSALLMYRSTKNGGASFNFPGRYVALTADVEGAATDLEDKQLLTVDASTTSPFRDRVYVTWTHYTATTAYIYESYSADYGETFSAPVRVSPSGSQVHCPNTLTTNGGCDNNQFSQPFTAPDGTLYVLYSNFNTSSWAHTARAQVLIQRSTDGGKTFDVPHKVSDYYDLPDCATYQGGQDPGRSCVPEKGSTNNSIFRASNYAVGAVNPDSPNRVVISIPSYINPDSNENNGCKPTGIEPSSGGGLYTGVKTPGACANHILVSTSLNNGVTFNGASTDPRQMPMAMTPGMAHTSQWFHWMTYSNHKLAIATYDRQYGDAETTGYSDQTLLGSVNGVSWASARVTTGSMPPPTQFAGVFWGDYSGLAAAGDTAWPLWSDTRVPDIFLCPGSGTPGNPPTLCGLQDFNGTANDEDIFVQSLPIPAGGA